MRHSADATVPRYDYRGLATDSDDKIPSAPKKLAEVQRNDFTGSLGQMRFNCKPPSRLSPDFEISS